MILPEIFAGNPGSGKTTALLNEVEKELAAGTEPERICYVSFTKKATTEATDRAVARFGFDRKRFRYFRTIHSICFQGLGLSNSDVFEGQKILEFGDWVGYQTRAVHASEDGVIGGFLPAERAMFMENLARVRTIPLRQQYEENHDDLPWTLVDRVSRGLKQYKDDHGLMDYTDMLREFVEVGDALEVDVLFVDEAQDLSQLQWRVVEKLGRYARRVVIAGDDDQAIYKWAGAAVEHFVDMPGAVTVLGQSWRCPAAVQHLSSEIISRVSHRRPKTWTPRDAPGVLQRAQQLDDVDLSGPDVLLLARNVYLMDDIKNKLRSDGIIYEYLNHSSIPQGILAAVVTWEKLRRGGEVSVPEARKVYEYMSSGYGVKRGHKSLPNFRDDEMVDINVLVQIGGLLTEAIWHEALMRIPTDEKDYMLRALKNGEKLTTGKPRVRLSTIHGAKGGEAEHVVVLTDMAKRTYGEYERSPEDEARVFYVAVTRAREQLTVVAPSSNLHYDM